jgi:hypothetical protein
MYFPAFLIGNHSPWQCRTNNLQGKQDYAQLPENIPALLANADVGHLGGFFEKQGGLNGRIAVPYFKWILKGDEKSKQLFFAQPNAFVNDGWNITIKNWK